MRSWPHNLPPPGGSRLRHAPVGRGLRRVALLLALLGGLLAAGPRAHAAPYGGTAVSVAPGAAPVKVEAENYDTGGEGVAYHDYDNGGQTGYRSDNIGVVAQAGTSNGYVLGWQDGAEWEAYTINVTQATAYTLVARVSGAVTGRSFHLEFGPVGQIGGAGVYRSVSFSVPNTGSYGTFQDVYVYGVSLNAGTQWVRLVLDGLSAGVAGIDYLSFASAASDNAAFVSQSVPATMTAGQSYAATVTMQNTGATAWTEANGYRLGSLNPANNATWGVARALLPSTTTVNPSGSYPFLFTATAPSAPGTYNWQWGMVHDGVAFFGATTPNLTVTVVAVPGVPSNLSAAGGTTQVSLTWNAASGATGYNLYRGTSPAGEAATPVKTNIPAGASPSTTDTLLASGTTYYYQVTAVNAAGTESGKSLEANAVTAPAAPAGFSASAFSANQINLSWSPSAGATGYTLERSPDNVNGWTGLTLSPATATSYSDMSRSAGTRYYYRLKATDTGGPSAYATANALTFPDAPTSFSASPASTSLINLSWTASQSATGYTLERSTDGTNWTLLTSTATSPYSDSGLSAGTAYSYRLKATNPNPSAYATANVTTPPAIPGTPTATPGDRQVTLSWPAAAGASSYNLYRGMSPAGEAATPVQTNIAAGASPSVIDTGLTNGTTYYYKVSAVSSAASGSVEGGQSNEAFATPVAPPDAPTPFSASAFSVSRIDLTWSPSTGATGYTLERSADSTNWTAVPLTPVTATSCQDTGLSPGTAYAYRLTATNAGGSSAYATANATTPTLAPTGLQAQAFSTSRIDLIWTAPAGVVSGYNVERSLDGTTWTQANGSLITVTSYSDTGLAMGTTYSYRVRAVNAGGASDPSTVVPATTPVAGPTGLTATPQSNAVQLQWNPVAGASSYNVYRGTGAGGEAAQPAATGLTFSAGAAPMWTDPGLSNGTRYFYQVTAVAGAESARSNEASATPGASLANPMGLTATPGDHQVTLSWNDVTGATGYNLYRQDGGSAPWLLVQQGLPGSPFPDTNLTNGTTYGYYVTAVNDDGQSANGYYYAVYATPGSTQLAAPLLSASAQSGSVQLQWSGVPGANTYNVYRSTTSGSGGAWIGSQTGTSWQDQNLTNNTRYYYQVAAVSNDGQGLKSNEASATPGTTPLAAPTNLIGTPGNGTVTLTWDAVPGATSYTVTRNGVLVATGVTATNFPDSGMGPGTFSYGVAGVNADGQGGFSYVSVSPNDFSLSVNPSTVSVVQGASQVADVGIARSGNVTDVSLSLAGTLPAGVTCTFFPSPTPTGSSLIFCVAPGAAPGTYGFTLTGTSGPLTRTVPISLTITAP